MADAAEDLFDEAMELPDSERRILALWLLDSAGEEPPEDVERAWLDEARRRLAAVRAGQEKPSAWSEAKKRIFARG